MGTCWVEKSWQHFEYKATTKTALHFNNFKLHMKNVHHTSILHLAIKEHSPGDCPVEGAVGAPANRNWLLREKSML